jgi:hypothetical protein
MCYSVLYPRYVYKSGETYDGEWVRGRRQGLGVLVHNSGDVYEGEFQQDKEVREVLGRLCSCLPVTAY